MRWRWRFGLCLWGAMLFSLLSFRAIRLNRELRQNRPNRYFWWGSVRLDSDPLDRHPVTQRPCQFGSEGDCHWNPQHIWVTPGVIEGALVLSAFPAFLAALAVVRGLARLGVNELPSFMLTMPLAILAWFCTVGWLLDRRRNTRSL